MNLYFIENDASVDGIVSSREFSAVDDIVVCVNYLAYLRFRERLPQAQAVFIEALFIAERYRELHAITDSFATDWRLRDGSDQTLFEGISFGEIAAIMLPRDYLANILVKYGEAIRLAAEGRPGLKRVVHDLSNDSNSFQMYTDDRGRFFNKARLVASVARQLGLESVYLPPPKLIPARSTSTLARFAADRPQALAARAKEAIRKLVAALSHLLYLVRGGANQSKATYFFDYFNIASLREHLRGRVILSRPSLRRLIAGNGYVDFLRMSVTLTSQAGHFLARLAEIFNVQQQTKSGYRFIYHGIDYAEIYHPVIEEIALARIPRLVRYSAQITKGLETYRIGRMITADVMTEMGKTLAAMCRKARVEIFFVDHGIMGHRFAQTVCRGHTPDLIIKPEAVNPLAEPYPYELRAPAVTLGNPSMDPYPVQKRKKVKAIKKILLTTFAEAFYGRLDRYAYQELYFRELFKAAAVWLDSGFEVHYRPHSENIAYHEYLFEFFGIDAKKIRYSHWRTPFRELIYDMDLLVCSVSNVFYEAQAAGVPTVFLDPVFIPEALWPPLDGTSWDEVIRVSTGEELAGIALRNRDDPAELNAFLDNFLDRHSHKYMHELDGHAGRRIAEYLEQTPPFDTVAARP